MLIVDMSAVKLPGEAKQSNLPAECGQPIDQCEKVSQKYKLAKPHYSQLSKCLSFIFQVSSTSTKGWNVHSEIASVNTLNTVPSQPTTLALSSNTQDGITITWRAPLGSASNVTHYKASTQTHILVPKAGR
jgi:hypothetical protein